MVVPGVSILRGQHNGAGAAAVRLAPAVAQAVSLKTRNTGQLAAADVRRCDSTLHAGV